MADWPYNTGQWRRLRLLRLRTEPLCEPCTQAGRIEVANTVDHRVPISAGGDAFPPLDGLASMCARCHSVKTARGVEAGAVRTNRAIQPRRGCDADGNPTDPAHPWHGKSLKAELDKTVVPQNAQLVRRDG
ncbi:HNH endonuclease [uncultured Sphingomonas sp.]|uniref:HNH endonuclease n=1 Tax=uncultured Sphingomonas sp. TaxID=158754 RepID=UPI0035C9CEAB